MSFNPGIVRVKGNLGETAEVTTYSQIISAMRHEDIVVRFEYNNSTEDISSTTSGTGALTNSSSMAIVASGAGVGASSIKSLRETVYVSGNEIFAFVSAIFSAGADASTYQRAGIFDTNDGMWFGYSGTSFGLAYRNGASDTFIAQTSWNVDKCDGTGPSGFIIDPSKLNLYKIVYGWFGGSPFFYYVYSGHEKGWIVVHVVENVNVHTAPSIGSPCLPITCEAGRTSGAGTSVTVSTSSWAAGSAKGMHTHAGHRTFAGQLGGTVAAGVETYLGSFRNDPTFAGKTNKVRTEACYIGAATDGTKSVSLRLYRNATITTPTWINVDANNSVTSYDTAGTLTLGTGKYEMPIEMAKVDTVALDTGAGHIHLELFPGETMTITGTSSAASDVLIGFRWEEYFA